MVIGVHFPLNAAISFFISENNVSYVRAYHICMTHGSATGHQGWLYNLYIVLW